MEVFFKANEHQLRKIVANAVNASEPVGLGMLQYKKKEYSPDEIEIGTLYPIYVDYYQGRMVKLVINRTGDGTWRTDNDLRLDYQSWKSKYPTAADLLQASGVDDFEIKEGEG